MIHIIGGGTFSHVRNHLALAAPAFGETAATIGMLAIEHLREKTNLSAAAAMAEVQLHLTRMAGGSESLMTNQDVGDLVDRLVADPKTRVIVMNAALCDYDGQIMETPIFPVLIPTESGKYAPRLKTSEGPRAMNIIPADKIISRIRKERKDIFLVAFKTTTGATSDEQYRAGLKLLKDNSANLVLANDTVTRNNMVITPEEARYYETDDRFEALTGLVEIMMARKDNTFTRSTVVEGDAVPWQSDMVPSNLREVVDHCIAAGAYKPFQGKTVGHFATRLDEGRILTSARKHDFNRLSEQGMVLVEYQQRDTVKATGRKPSVGGMSQRIIFEEHPDVDCIVHAHIELRANAPDIIPIVDQWPNECGSHQCGQNTSRGLKVMSQGIKAVMLDNHGPNIVFSRDTPAQDVIQFIERNFDLTTKTGGPVA